MAALLGQAWEWLTPLIQAEAGFCLPAFRIPWTPWELLETYKRAKYGYPQPPRQLPYPSPQSLVQPTRWE